MSTCKICSQALTIELDPEDFNEATSSAAGGSFSTIPDDVSLTCHCHFHWQCLLDESSTIASSLACPSCNSPISTASGGSQQPQVITQYHNEGGIQNNLDIFPLIIEEAYLEANPTARPARAAMTMYGEGDVGGVVELLEAIDEDSDEGDMSGAELLRYQDPLDGMKSGLHIAIEKGKEDVAWFLLWTASSTPTSSFPEHVSRSAMAMGVSRGTAQGLDIRSLRDAAGRTAEDTAESMGGAWHGWINGGILKA